MKIKKLAPLFNGAISPGIYRFTSRARPETVATVAQQAGWCNFYVDGHNIRDKATFLRTFAAAMNFPPYCGHNWDAFEECITDLVWAPAQSYLVLYDHVADFAANAPQEWSIALDILREAVAYWQTKGTPMAVLLRDSGRAALDVPKL